MARSPAAEPRVRLNLELSERARAHLERVRVLSGADSLTETVRRAVGVYGLLLEECAAGRRVLLQDDAGRERELLLERET